MSLEVKKEFEENKSILKQCVSAIENILGVDIDGDGEVKGNDKIPPWNEDTHEFHLRIMTADHGHRNIV